MASCLDYPSAPLPSTMAGRWPSGWQRSPVASPLLGSSCCATSEQRWVTCPRRQTKTLQLIKARYFEPSLCFHIFHTWLSFFLYTTIFFSASVLQDIQINRSSEECSAYSSITCLKRFKVLFYKHNLQSVNITSITQEENVNDCILWVTQRNVSKTEQEKGFSL